MRVKVEIKKQFAVEFDHENVEFEEIFRNYRKHVNPDASYCDFSEHVIVCFVNQNPMPEHIGPFKINGKKQIDFPSIEHIDHPVNVIANNLTAFETDSEVIRL